MDISNLRRHKRSSVSIFFLLEDMTHLLVTLQTSTGRYIVDICCPSKG
jgi:hypothetical protein